MPDVLIRNVPAETVSNIDREAELLRLSRNEFLRRQLITTNQGGPQQVTMDDLKRAATLFQDLSDPAVMEAAWQ